MLPRCWRHASGWSPGAPRSSCCRRGTGWSARRIEMAMNAERARKLADRIVQIVAEMLERRVKDPRLGFVTVTEARLTGDLREATVYYTVYGTAEEQAGSAAALASATGLIRTEVGRQTGLRHTPSLTFVRDTLPEGAQHMEDLVARARAADAELAAAREGAQPAGDPDPYRPPAGAAPGRLPAPRRPTRAGDRGQRAGHRRQARRADLARRGGPDPPAGRDAPGGPCRDARPHGDRGAGDWRREGHPPARPSGPHREGVPGHHPAGPGHRHRRRRGDGDAGRIRR